MPVAGPIVGAVAGAVVNKALNGGGGGGGSTQQTTQQQIDPRIANFLFGPNGNGGLFSEAQNVYNRHAANPFNDLQKQAIGGILGYLGSGQGLQGMNASNQLAAKFLGGAGVNFQPTTMTSLIPGVDLGKLLQGYQTNINAQTPTPTPTSTGDTLTPTPTPTADNPKPDKAGNGGVPNVTDIMPDMAIASPMMFDQYGRPVKQKKAMGLLGMK